MSKFGKRGPRNRPAGDAPVAAPAAALERPPVKPAPRLPAPPVGGPPVGLPVAMIRPPAPALKPRILKPSDVLVVKGPTYEALRKQVQGHSRWPRAFYASSLVHGNSRMDGKDEIGEMLGQRGVSVRDKVAEVWQRCGGVIVVHEGVPKLVAVKE